MLERPFAHCYETGAYPAANPAGKVDTQKGEVGIGNGIDQIPNQVLAGRGELAILATELDVPQSIRVTGELHQTIRTESGAIDGEAAFDGSATRFENDD